MRSACFFACMIQKVSIPDHPDLSIHMVIRAAERPREKAFRNLALVIAQMQAVAAILQLYGAAVS